jgi:hypothetical protein
VVHLGRLRAIGWGLGAVGCQPLAPAHLRAGHGAADGGFPEGQAAEFREPAFHPVDARAEGLAAGFGGEGDEDTAVVGVASAEGLDGGSEPGDGAVLAPAGAVGAGPEPAALGGDRPMDVTLHTHEDAEVGATACDFLRLARCPELLEAPYQMEDDRA